MSTGQGIDLYRPRRARESPLYGLVEACYDAVKRRWEEDFEGRYGLWRGRVEDAVYAFLDCGVFEQGFARVSCSECRAELQPPASLSSGGYAARRSAAPAGPDLVAFSCQRR